MRTIRLRLNTDALNRLDECGTVIIPVYVNWFPPLTDDQHMANGLARIHGFAPPHSDPNVLAVELRYSESDHDGPDRS